MATDARNEFIIKFKAIFTKKFNALIKQELNKEQPSSFVSLEVHKTNLYIVKEMLNSKGYKIEYKHLAFTDLYILTAYF
ncbi:hypothetical protein PV-S19_0048 [Pacmanvirus S19]|nr:hypothetical protein PV-S19_0048 [Pacmanvirus S19]